MNLGERLEQAIIGTGMSINAVAEKAGISAQTLYSIIKRNNKKVDVDILLKLLDITGVSFEYLVEDEILSQNKKSPSVETESDNVTSEKFMRKFAEMDTNDQNAIIEYMALLELRRNTL